MSIANALITSVDRLLFFILFFQILLARISEWPFNAFALDRATGGNMLIGSRLDTVIFIFLFARFPLGRPLPTLCFHLFHQYGLMAHFHLDPVKVWKFFSKPFSS